MKTKTNSNKTISNNMKLKSWRLFFIAIATLVSTGAYSQAPVKWSITPSLFECTANSFGNETPTKIVYASDGSVIVAGSFIDSIYATGGFAFRISVKKYSGTGTLLSEYIDADPDYVNIAGFYPGLNDYVFDMVIDASDNVYFIASQSDTVTVGGTLYKGIRGLFKLDSDMNLRWKTITPENDWLSMTLDGNGNVIINGTTKNTNTGNGTNIVTAKYNSRGNNVWTKIYSSTGNSTDSGSDITTDIFNNIYVCGVRQSATAGNSIVVIQYNDNGTRLWKQVFNIDNTTSGSDRGVSMIASPTGNCYVLAYGARTDGKQYPTILKYDIHGVLQWSKVMKEHLNATTQFLPVKIRLDASENVYVAAYTTSFSFTRANVTKILKYRSNGDFQWKISRDTMTVTDFDVSSNGMVYAAGYFAKYSFAGQSIAFNYDAGGNLVWEDQYAPDLVPNQTSAHSGAYCLAINPADETEVIIGATVNAKNSVAGLYSAAWLVRDFDGTPRLTGQAGQIKLTENFITVYPNPASDRLVLTTNVEMNNVPVNIVDMFGKTVRTFVMNNENEIDISNLAKGVYFIIATQSGKQIKEKFMKE